jgi:hypothetical protein
MKYQPSVQVILILINMFMNIYKDLKNMLFGVGQNGLNQKIELDPTPYSELPQTSQENSKMNQKSEIEF